MVLKAQSVVAIVIGIGLAGLVLALFSFATGSLGSALYVNSSCVASNEAITVAGVNGTWNLTVNAPVVPGSEVIFNSSTLAWPSNLTRGGNYTINNGTGNVTYFNTNFTIGSTWNGWNSSKAFINYSYYCELSSYVPTTNVINQLQATFLTLAGFLIVFAVLGIIGLFLGMFGGGGVQRGGKGPGSRTV